MNLDEVESFSSIDSKNILDTLNHFPDQIHEAEKSVSDTDIPRLYDIDHILISGSGHNALSGLLLQSYLKEKSVIPISVDQSGKLPKWANKHTLVISVSYTGEDLESISCFKEAIQKHCKIISVCSTGHLKEYCIHRKIPYINLSPDYYPRTSIALLFFSMLFGLLKTGLYQLNLQNEIQDCIYTLNEMKKNNLSETPISQNPAKQLAIQINTSTPLVLGWDAFSSVAQYWSMLFNQNTKRLSNYYIVPACTYDTLVGWANTIKSQEYASIIFRDHQSESKEMKKRLFFLERFYHEVTDKQISVNPSGKNTLSKMFSLLYLGEMVSIYTAILSNIDPGPTPIIHQLDEELALL